MNDSDPRTADGRGRAFRIHKDAHGHRAGIERVPRPEPAEGEVLVRVAWSGVNYKDALAGTGRGKILKTFPLTGGIDASGTIAATRHPAFREGDAVVATGRGLSFDRDGGYADWLCCPGDWLVPLPAGFDLRSALVYGTAGLTAALALHRMLVNGQRPDMGPILVTGASGGVGSLAIAMLRQAGFQAIALSGKPALHDWLRGLGAVEILPRDALAGAIRPLESARFGGAIDNVGGELLAQITRTVVPWGNIVAVGLTGGHELHTTVMPFILRGVSLLGLSSSDIPAPLRATLWERLAGDWHPSDLETIATETIGLHDLPAVFERMLAGATHGRILVDLAR